MKIVLLFVIVLFTSCTVKTPAVSEYRIATLVKNTPISNSTCKDKSLKIGHVFSSSALMSQKMNYIENEDTESSYTESAWSRSPARAITAQILSSVRATKLFKNVVNYKTRSRNDLVLESNLEEFVQYYRDDNTQSFVKIVLSLSLVDIKTSKTISSTLITKETDVQTLNAAGGVKALNKVLSETLEENNKWLSGVCK